MIRRVWAPRGRHPRAAVRTRYQWLYVYGFVRPTTGETFWLLMPTVSVEACGVALAAFARTVAAGPDKQVVLVVDQAGWHVSPRVELPTGLHLALLPPYSPELQPAERLWPLVNEPVANRSFRDLDELDVVLGDRCLALETMPAAIRAHTSFHWWPK